ncbi:MAG: hypothetical protein DKINENOH_04399 [bacterium]|nr:hypothetical protein [bacterium]
MITEKRQCPSWRPLCLLLAVALCGCSIIGLTIGAISDSRRSSAVTIPGWQVETLKAGSRIEALLWEGSSVTGKYTGIELMPLNQYDAIYSEALARLPEGIHFPGRGDTIIMTFATHVPETPETTVTGQLSRLELGNIRVVQNRTGTSSIVGWRLSELLHLSDQKGNHFTGETVRDLIGHGKIPVRSALALSEGGEKRLIAANQVQEIHVLPAKKSGALTGFLVGAAIDAVVLIAAASADYGGGLSTSESGSMSCPFVYSFDGRQYVLDSETFGGAIFRAAQRTDLDNLDHLTEVNGSYRIKITNELPETQFVDELRLLVVDHPRDTRVVPSFSGKIHTLAAPQPPNKATSYRGDEVQNLIIDKDNRVWVSNPFGRNPEDKSQARDGLLLEFPRPAGTNAAKLCCNLQNTLWASYLQGQLLALHGRELPTWYARMNSSPEARAALFQAMVREGMLRVQVGNGQNWQEAGFFWEVGPSVPKDQVLWLDLSNISGETLQVKLESTAGFWMINSVAIDYSPEAESIVTELLPQQARDQLGRDQREILTNNDARYYVMPAVEDWAELVFAAPPARPGYQRSILLKSSGYYEIHVTAAGEPQRELVAKLMTEPGAYGQYTLRLLQQYHDNLLAKMQ